MTIAPNRCIERSAVTPSIVTLTAIGWLGDFPNWADDLTLPSIQPDLASVPFRTMGVLFRFDPA